MGKIFDLDSPLMRVLSKMADLMMLNILMIIMCIPVVTAGASFTAMHYVCLKMVRDEDNYLFKSFFKSFRLNFRQATIIWLLMLLLTVVFVWDFIIMKGNQNGFPQAFVMLLLAIIILALLVCMYVFPVLARFDNTIKNTIKNSFFMMALNLPKTILMAIVYVAPLVIMYVLPVAFPMLLLFGFSLPAYTAAMLYNKIFLKFEPEQEAITSDEEFSIAMEDAEETKTVDEQTEMFEKLNNMEEYSKKSEE